jgi:hypothetical protein
MLRTRGNDPTCSSFEGAHRLALLDLDRWTVNRRSTCAPQDVDIVVAIPVQNEANRIADCIHALTNQCPRFGRGKVHVVLLANGCSDGTTDWLFENMARWLVPATVIEAQLHSGEQ